MKLYDISGEQFSAMEDVYKRQGQKQFLLFFGKRRIGKTPEKRAFRMRLDNGKVGFHILMMIHGAELIRVSLTLTGPGENTYGNGRPKLARKGPKSEMIHII